MSTTKSKRSAPKQRYRPKTVPEFQSYVTMIRRSLTLMKKKVVSKSNRDKFTEDAPTSAQFTEVSKLLTELVTMYKRLCKTPARNRTGGNAGQGFKRPLWVSTEFLELINDSVGEDVDLLGGMMQSDDREYTTFSRALVTSAMSLMNRSEEFRSVSEEEKTYKSNGQMKTRMVTVKKYAYPKDSRQYDFFKGQISKDLSKGFTVSDVSKFTKPFIFDNIPLSLSTKQMSAVMENLDSISEEVKSLNAEYKAEEDAQAKRLVQERKLARIEEARRKNEEKLAERERKATQERGALKKKSRAVRSSPNKSPRGRR